MTTVLQINASIHAEGGQSSQLAQAFVRAYRANHPGVELVVRDVVADPVPHLDSARFAAFTTPPAQRNAAQQAIVAYSDQLIEELRHAELIVLGLPMYNFGVPSQLKAYFDHVARSGVTFRYTAQGPVGLLGGKRAIIFAARGGLYAGTPQDTQSGYVRDFLRFIGIDNVRFVYAEGLAVDPSQRTASLENAGLEIARLAA